MKSSALRHPARLAGASLLRLQSDERLAELASSGHPSAFDAIVDRYRTPLMRYCAGIVGPSRAEDAVQQALINAHDALQRTDEVRNLRSWLYRIAHNASLNVLRAVRDDVPLDEHELAASGGGAGVAGPAESFERSEQFRSTLAALQALPDRQRAALVLRELEGRSHEEIAAALGVTKGSARQHLMRARVAVRAAVTAVTPYPLVVRLAEWASGGAAASGWVDAAATAGAGASLAKLTAGLAATGALVGGAVGTEHVVHRGSNAPSIPRAAERSAEHVVKRASEMVVALPAATAAPQAMAPTAARTSTPRHAPSRSPSSAPPHRDRRSAPRDTSTTPASAPVTTTAPSTAHRGRDDSSSDDHRRGRSGDDDRHSHRDRASSRDDGTPTRDGKLEKHDKGERSDQRDSSGRSKQHDRAPTTPTASHGSDGSSSNSGSSPSTSGSGSSSDSSGSNTATTTESSGPDDTTSGKTTTTETPSTTTTSTTTTSPTSTDDGG